MRLLETILKPFRTRSIPQTEEDSRHHHASHQPHQDNDVQDKYPVSIEQARALAQNLLDDEGSCMFSAHNEPRLGPTLKVMGRAVCIGLDYTLLMDGAPGNILVNRETGEAAWGPNPPFPQPSFPGWINEFLARPSDD